MSLYRLDYTGRVREADDWLTEPEPVETLHDKYTRRLVAWGWLVGDTPAWEITTLSKFGQLLKQEYIGAMTDMLNQPCFFLGSLPWWHNPEAPVS